MHRRTIRQLATEHGIGLETIRFYERRGLIPQPVRAGGGYRHYGDDVAAMIRYIRLAQQLGLSLKDVERLKRVSPRRLADEYIAPQRFNSRLGRRGLG